MGHSGEWKSSMNDALSQQALTGQCHRQIARCGQLSEMTLPRMGTGRGDYGAVKSIAELWLSAFSRENEAFLLLHTISEHQGALFSLEKRIFPVSASSCAVLLPGKFLSTLDFPLSLSANRTTSRRCAFEICFWPTIIFSTKQRLLTIWGVTHIGCKVTSDLGR